MPERIKLLSKSTRKLVVVFAGYVWDAFDLKWIHTQFRKHPGSSFEGMTPRRMAALLR
jgi:hypothetical protein